MKLKEVLESLRLDGSFDQQCKEYARQLHEGETNIVAEELIGDDYSSNRICEWDKKKAFINTHVHEVDFEDISRLFEVPPPPGHFIFKDVPDPVSMGENDKVIAKIGKDRYAVIKIEVVSSKVRLISAFEISRQEFERQLSQHLIRGNAKILAPINSAFRAEDGVMIKSRVGCDVSHWARLYLSFLEGVIDKEDVVSMLCSDGLSKDEALWFVNQWQIDKNANYLASLMGKM